jgi:phage baseplate assembly protein W
VSLEDFLKTDLSLAGGDLQPATGGDFLTVSLEENVKQAVFNRIITVPGTLLHRPNYGVGLPAFLNEPLSMQKKKDLARTIKQNVERDPRIEEVTAVSIQEVGEGTGVVDLSVSYKIVGYGLVTSNYEGVGA